MEHCNFFYKEVQFEHEQEFVGWPCIEERREDYYFQIWVIEYDDWGVPTKFYMDEFGDWTFVPEHAKLFKTFQEAKEKIRPREYQWRLKPSVYDEYKEAMHDSFEVEGAL